MAGSAPAKMVRVEGPSTAREVQPLSLRATYHSLQISHKQPIQYLSRLITVSYILKSLRCILAAHIKEHFLSPSVTALSARIPINTNSKRKGGHIVRMRGPTTHTGARPQTSWHRRLYHARRRRGPVHPSDTFGPLILDLRTVRHKPSSRCEIVRPRT